MNAKYNKLYAAGAGLLVQLLTLWLGASSPALVTAVAALTALGVYAVKNDD